MRACVLLLLLAAAAAEERTFAVAPLAPDPARDARVEALIDALRGIEEFQDGITCWSMGGIGFDALSDDAPPGLLDCRCTSEGAE